MITEITRKKMRDAKLGTKLSKVTTDKMSASHKGQKHSEETKQKISICKIGSKNPMYGKKGDKNPSWKGGKTDIYDTIRTSIEYYQWRMQVFVRDRYVCQHCGDSKGGNLSAHHIKSFSSILRENEIKTFSHALECSELWETRNGLTLCDNCHKKTDNYAGRGEKKNMRKK